MHVSWAEARAGPQAADPGTGPRWDSSGRAGLTSGARVSPLRGMVVAAEALGMEAPGPVKTPASVAAEWAGAFAVRLAWWDGGGR